MKVSFGDLPLDAQAMLTRHLRVDFSRCDFKAPRWFSAWARNDQGHVVGIFSVEFPVWFEGKVTVLVLDPRCLSRRVLRAIFRALFSQVKRLTAEVEPSNPRALRQVQRLGFQFEGHHPLGLEGTRDTIVFGMLKEECPWLRSYVPPVGAGLDEAHRRLTNTIVSSDGTLRPRIGTDRENLGLGEFGVGLALSAPRHPFSKVLTVGPPTDVRTTDAAPGAARVRSNGSLRWLAVGPDADETVNTTGLPVQSYVAVSVPSNSVRPEKAVVAAMCERDGQRHLRS